MDGIARVVYVLVICLQNVVMDHVMVTRLLKLVQKTVMNQVAVLEKLLIVMNLENVGLTHGLVMDSAMVRLSSMELIFAVMIMMAVIALLKNVHQLKVVKIKV